ncbi:MAG: phenylalanine--tRNA ligase subunit beta [Bdellovibrionales bacterium]
MKISLRWLNDYVPVQEYFEKPDKLVQLLTSVGLEVESTEDLGARFKNVVVGCILEKAQHPGADRLTVCQVSTGHGIVHQIVCGAKNHNQGDRVVVALPGAVLPGDFAIKDSVIRGVASKGMLCSETELGLSADESPGIMILPVDAPIGTTFAEYMKLDDVILEIKVTPNRSDCLSHFGLAREIAAIKDVDYNFPLKSFKESSNSTKNEIELVVKNQDLCPRYSGRYIANVKVGPSPLWMKSRLEAVGLKSINNIVDITNYVMMELGQPLHAFDVKELKGKKIIVDMAKPDEAFKTLDGTELKLTGQELLIRDGERGVALAGVVGGQNSGINDDTKNVFLECAYFNPAGVRRTARQHGIETDSAYRFTRGVNPDAVMLALNRASELLQDLAGGELYNSPHDFYPQPIPKKIISFDVETATKSLGYKVEKKDFIQWMERLECEVKDEGETLKISPPLYRWDINQDMDLVEEYSRLNGYDKIPETLPALKSAPARDDQEFLFLNRSSDIIRTQGYRQAVNYAFVSSQAQKQFLGDVSQISFLATSEPVKVMNPISDELDAMRVSLLPGLSENLKYNYRHGVQNGRLFELGHVFHKVESEYHQHLRAAFVVWGQKTNLWEKQKEQTILFELKGHLDILLSQIGIGFWEWKALTGSPAFLHPGQSIGLYHERKPIGVLGALHPLLSEEWKLRVPTVMAEINLSTLMTATKKRQKIRTPSKFPSVERDLAFVMPKEMESAMVTSVMKKAAKEFLKKVDIFDEFLGAPLKENEKSLAFKLTLQDDSGTLTEEKLAELQKRLIDSVSSELLIRIR